MSGVKITAADRAFADCLKAAHDNTCEWCGIIGRMETSHVHSRRHRTIRWDKLNANCLCNGCHRRWHESPLAASEWFSETFGEGRVAILREKMNNRVKVPKSEEKDIAKHYREELKKINEARNNGITGYVDFMSWQ